MKAKTIAGALAAAALWGGAALASAAAPVSGDDANCPPTSSSTEAQSTQQPDPSESAVGGSGEQGMTEQTTPETTQTQPAYVAPVVVAEDDDLELEERRNRDDMKGLTVLLGGGIEGYTGRLAPEIEPGVGYGVTASIKPSRVVGLELGYSGAVNNLRDDAREGGDLVRNGAQAAVTVGLTATPVQPYLLGGVGLNHYDYRGESGRGFRDDTSGYIPLGIGLRTHLGDFTADARGTWSALFEENFSSTSERDVIGVDVSRAGRFGGMIQLGATF